jgi:hypothetical protein
MGESPAETDGDADRGAACQVAQIKRKVGSVLAEIARTDRLGVKSTHHQGSQILLNLCELLPLL